MERAVQQNERRGTVNERRIRSFLVGGWGEPQVDKMSSALPACTRVHDAKASDKRDAIPSKAHLGLVRHYRQEKDL